MLLPERRILLSFLKVSAPQLLALSHSFTDSWSGGALKSLASTPNISTQTLKLAGFLLVTTRPECHIPCNSECIDTSTASHSSFSSFPATTAATLRLLSRRDVKLPHADPAYRRQYSTTYFSLHQRYRNGTRRPRFGRGVLYCAGGIPAIGRSFKTFSSTRTSVDPVGVSVGIASHFSSRFTGFNWEKDNSPSTSSSSIHSSSDSMSCFTSVIW